MRSVSIIGIGMTPFGKSPERGLKQMATTAVREALDDAAIEPDRIGALFFANAIAGLITGQEMIRGQVSLRDMGFEGVPVMNVENACASGSTAVHLAWQSVASGACDVALAVGAEKMTHPDRSKTFAAIGAAVDVERAAEEFGVTDLSEITATRSPFVDVYAEIADRYLARSGGSVHDLARVAQKNHEHGARNPLAQYGGTLTLEEIEAARRVAGVLTLHMCAPISDGAAAMVLAASPTVSHRDTRPVYIRASVVTSGSAGSGMTPAQVRASRRAYEMAGIGPEQVDVAEVHDATAVAELIAYEDLGFVESGGGTSLIRSGETALGGRLPVNPSGGLLARGHPIGATGVAQLVELVHQLRGTATDRQVDGARTALASNGGGWIIDDAAAESVHILSRDSA